MLELHKSATNITAAALLSDGVRLNVEEVTWMKANFAVDTATIAFCVDIFIQLNLRLKTITILGGKKMEWRLIFV